jgi:uncharacterized protein YkwD
MGLADRDYMRQRRSRRPWLANSFGILLLAALVLAGLTVLRSRDDPSPAVVVSPGVFGIRLTSPSQPLYPPNDPWKAYLAPERACPHGEDRTRPVEAQAQTMICLLNWARRRRGLRPLANHPLLARAAAFKARDIVACGDFAHEACGKPSDAVVAEAGFTPNGWGENIYAGPRAFGSPRVAADGWLNSTGHRENLFRSDWTHQGVALLPLRSFDGQPDVAIWVSHFAR